MKIEMWGSRYAEDTRLLDVLESFQAGERFFIVFDFTDQPITRVFYLRNPETGEQYLIDRYLGLYKKDRLLIDVTSWVLNEEESCCSGVM